MSTQAGEAFPSDLRASGLLPEAACAYLLALLADRGQLNHLGQIESRQLKVSTAYPSPQPPAQGAHSETLENGTTLVQTGDAGALVVEGELTKWLEAAARQARPEGIQARQAASSAGLSAMGGVRDTLTGLGLPQADAEVYMEGLRQGQGLLIVEGQPGALKALANRLGVEHQLFTPTPHTPGSSETVATGNSEPSQAQQD